MLNENLKIESYSLGHLACWLNKTSPVFESTALEIPAPAQDICFVRLMREYGILSNQNRMPVSTRKTEYQKYVTLYRLGYRDSLENNKCLIKVVKRKKIWSLTHEIK